MLGLGPQPREPTKHPALRALARASLLDSSGYSQLLKRKECGASAISHQPAAIQPAQLHDSQLALELEVAGVSFSQVLKHLALRI